MRSTATAISALLLIAGATACSNFLMSNDYQISVRTMDLGSADLSPGLSWGLLSIPKGSAGTASRGPAAAQPTKYAALAFSVLNNSVPAAWSPEMVTGGMNEVGLSCDSQTLLGSSYPNKTGTSKDLDLSAFCGWALEGYSSTLAVKEALDAKVVVVWGSAQPDAGTHFALRDATNLSIVVEFIDKQTMVYVDGNDEGKTGFGVMTNEPPWPWQTENVRHFLWKEGMARSAISMPGNWYPDERYLRIYKAKSSMARPGSYAEAISQAVQVLNTITVPIGEQIGTDSGVGEGEADHTNYGVVYDHKRKVVYWRTETNQNLQRVALSDIFSAKSEKPIFLPLMVNELPFYNDAFKSFKAAAPAPAGDAADAAGVRFRK